MHGYISFHFNLFYLGKFKSLYHIRVHYLPVVLCNTSVISNHGACTFLIPIRFIAHKAEWKHVGIYVNDVPVVTSGCGPRSAWHNCTFISDKVNHSIGTPAMVVRASCGPLMGIFNVFHIPLDPHGARARPSRVPLRTCNGFNTTQNCSYAFSVCIRTLRALYGEATLVRLR